MLFMDIKDSLDNVFILLWFLVRENLEINRLNDIKIMADINASKYKPLCGSLAKEWTLSMIPDLTINAPNKLKENTLIDKSMVQVLKCEDLIETLNEWRNAVAANQGIKDTFSTGSQNQ